MGRKAGQWQVEAFVLRNRWADYEAARDRLRDALNAAGPGTLIHPWLGQMSVAVDSYTLRESTREGGYCKFSITFVEAGSLTCPDIQADTAAGVEEAVNAAEEAAEESFLERLNMLPEDLESALSFAEGIADTVINCLNTGSRLLSDVKSQIRRVIAIPDRLAGALLGLGHVRNGPFLPVRTRRDRRKFRKLRFGRALQFRRFRSGRLFRHAFHAQGRPGRALGKGGSGRVRARE